MRDGLAAKNIFLKDSGAPEEERRATCRSVSVRGRAEVPCSAEWTDSHSHGMRRQSWDAKAIVRGEGSPCNTKASILQLASKASPILGKVRRCEHACSHCGPSPGSGVAYAPTKV